MNKLFFGISTLLLAVALIACQSQEKTRSQAVSSSTAIEQDTSKPQKIVKTEAEWRKELSPEQFRILRQKGTERAFTGAYWDNKSKGMYHCAACNLPLFDSETKFKSGTGWPSFYQPVADGNVTEYSDNTFGMVRTEVTCGRCDGHLGHVFDDGPRPTGLRYCINSESLVFEKAGK